MEQDNDERELLERFRRGEPGAFDALYQRYGPRLYRFSLRLCGNPTDAEDLTQEVFVAAYRGLHRFEGRSSLATFLYRVAVYRWRQTRESARRRPETVPWDDRHPPTAPDDPAGSGIRRADLRAALSQLPEAHRAAFLLVKAEGLTCREAADVLGIPVGTVKYHVYEAVSRLQACLAAPETRADARRKEACDAV